jgi:hypothetical protein
MFASHNFHPKFLSDFAHILFTLLGSHFTTVYGRNFQMDGPNCLKLGLGTPEGPSKRPAKFEVITMTDF